MNTFDMLETNSLYEVHPYSKTVQLSKSKIDLFYTCHWQYFFRYLTNYPLTTVVWPATLFGETVHEVLENTITRLKTEDKIKKIRKENKGAFKTIYDRKLIERGENFKKSKGYKYETFIKDGEKYSDILVQFVSNYFSESFNLIPEIEFSFEVFPDITFTGFADLVVYHTETDYSIYDFKTTKDSFKYYVIDWTRDLQSNIYLFLMRKQYAENYAKKFGYLVMNYQLDQLFIKANKIKDDQKDDMHYFNLLKIYINPILEFLVDKSSKKFQYTPANQTKCYWCSYKKMCNFNKSRGI